MSETVKSAEEGVQVHGLLRGEIVNAFGRGIFIVHDFIADDGAEFNLATKVTENFVRAEPRSKSNA
jgi:hypothetical protein